MSHSNGVITKQMPLTRRRILALLKERGKLTADQLSDHLDISSVAVRRHLIKLERDALVDYEEVQRGMGRPSYVYRLGPAAASFFPRAYEELALSVLETVRQLYGAEALEAVFQVRSEHLINSYRPKVTGQTLDERLEQLAELRRKDGYMSSWCKLDEQTYQFSESNCPIITAATECECACQQDLIMLEELLNAGIARQTHICGGDNACSYTVTPKN